MNEQDREPLTERQREVLDAIRTLVRARGRTVSLEEIAAAADLHDRAHARSHVKNLEKKGYLRHLAGHRGVELVDDPGPGSFPLIGLVAAGAPLPTFSDLGRFEFHAEFPDAELFAVKVRGSSMIDAQIADGDFALIRRDPDPAHGAKVVCSIDGELTLKVLRRPKGEVWLYPCNRDMKAFKLRPDEGTFIIGVLVGVVRKC